MKTRSDFVTNSSSSSFVGYGVHKNDLPQPTDADRVKFFNIKFKDYQEYNRRGKDYQGGWWRSTYIDMTHCITDKAKADYIAEHWKWYFEEFYYQGDGSGILSYGANYVAVLFEYMFADDNFEDIRVCDVKATVANKLNEKFGANLTEDDIVFVDEEVMN